ncbi:hypothetical protein [Paraburkholderia sp. BL25I1N1]|uniref:hypothetical protein n=1 Tax=Paraburkholderia sp. BL25I1N1 TaxID=1938804 RepID=UPI0011B2222F|nr:hypothetical protein [Paraburkholderia sp. BL25I1N1]
MSRFISLMVGNAQPALRTFVSRHPLLAKRCVAPREELKTFDSMLECLSVIPNPYVSVQNSKTSDGAAATLIPNPHSGAPHPLSTGVSSFCCFFARINTRQPISSGRSKSRHR